MRKITGSFFLIFLLSLLLFNNCKKDDKNNSEIFDSKAYLWEKWWYNDIQTNVFFSSDGTCKYFDNSFNGTWEWIKGSDTMIIHGITTPISWKMFFWKIELHNFSVSFDNDNFQSSYTYTDQE